MDSENINYIIADDINIHLLKYQIGTHISGYVNHILSCGCMPLIQYTNSPDFRLSLTHPYLIIYIQYH